MRPGPSLRHPLKSAPPARQIRRTQQRFLDLVCFGDCFLPCVSSQLKLPPNQQGGPRVKHPIESGHALSPHKSSGHILQRYYENIFKEYKYQDFPNPTLIVLELLTKMFFDENFLKITGTANISAALVIYFSSHNHFPLARQAAHLYVPQAINVECTS